VRPYGTGEQYWYNPNTGEIDATTLFHQVNIENIDDPFIQEIHEVYWLDISIRTESPYEWGWRTSLDQFENPGVWTDAPGGSWQSLWSPVVWETLDLAFVITPEPVTLGLLLVGGLALSTRSRLSLLRNRKHTLS
jgi:hypothetical protein